LIDYLNTQAEAIILIVVLILAFFSIVVFFGAIYSRWVLNVTEKRQEKIREELSDKVIQYVSGDLSFKELSEELSTKSHYTILLKLSNELDKSLEGEEATRLKRLMNLKPIREFFTGRFRSRNSLERAKACLYFSKQTVIKNSLIPTILSYTKAEYPMLAYSAAMAIMVHGSIEEKKETIHHLLINENLSNQALNDVFAEFQNRSADDREAESKLLMELIDNRMYASDRTALMIRTLGELGFYDSAGFLLNEYMELPEKVYDASIAEALIDVLSGFGMIEIVDRLHSDFSSSKFSEVREASAKAMGVFCDPVSRTYLKWMLYDSDFYVRFHAAKSLSNYPEVDLETMKVPNMKQKDWDELLGEIEISKQKGY
jgi:hypothetical protein